MDDRTQHITVRGLLHATALLIVLLLISACSSVPTGTGTGFSFNKTPGTGAVNGGATAVITGKGTPTAGTTAQGTTAIDATVTYANDAITVVDATLAKSFTDDTHAAADGMSLLRLNFKEQTTDIAPTLGNGGNDNTMHLILPNGNPVNEVGAQESAVPPASTARTNWVDFEVPSTVNVSQLILRLGVGTEHQIDVPLKAHTDVSKYQARTITPNTAIKYAGLNWTLVSATWTLSAQGNQAGKDMSYVILSFKVENPTTDPAYIDNGTKEAFRLKVADTSAAPTYSTFPSAIQPGETGITGTLGFLVAQDSTAFTLLMLVTQNTFTSTTQVATPFQIPQK